MTLEIVVGGNAAEYVIRDIMPKSIERPDGVETVDGNDYGVINQDFYPSDRNSPLRETNATQPDRPVDPAGILWALWSLLTGWRVSPQGKIIVPLTGANWPRYWQMFIDFSGERNAYKMLEHGNGYFDTGNFMCSPSGGDLVHLLDEIYQAGTWYDVVERFDFSVAPAKQDGIWYYKNRPVSPQLTPHLFATRTNRRIVDPLTWITSGGVNNVSDAGNGQEHWPLVANRVAAQPRSKIRRYPSLPREMWVYADSLVMDGNLMERIGVRMMVDGYRFHGSSTAVREKYTGLWYKGDEMLQRVKEPYSATGFDYRCYVSLVNKTPWMGARAYRSPLADWQKL